MSKIKEVVGILTPYVLAVLWGVFLYLADRDLENIERQMSASNKSHTVPTRGVK